MDWKYALDVELTDPGFDFFSVLGVPRFATDLGHVRPRMSDESALYLQTRVFEVEVALDATAYLVAQPAFVSEL